jgi:F0F1-type ATP synthase membrane subunit b/b'
MPSEFAPPGRNARMTKAQIKKYLQNMKKAKQIAQAKIAAAEANGEMEKEQAEVEKLEEKLDNL